MHARHSDARKPNVSFKTPTYFIGGSDYSLTRQGGFILRVLMTALFSVRNIDKKIEESGMAPAVGKIDTPPGNRKSLDFSGDFLNIKSFTLFRVSS